MSQNTMHFTFVGAGILVLVVALGFMVRFAWIWNSPGGGTADDTRGVSASPGNESPDGSVSPGIENPERSMSSELDGRQLLPTNTYPVAFRGWRTGAPVVARRVRVLSGDEGTTLWQGQTNADGAIYVRNTVKAAIAKLSLDNDWRQVSRVSHSNPIVHVHPQSQLVVRLDPELSDSEARLCRLEMQVVDGPSELPRFESDRRLWEVRGVITRVPVPQSCKVRLRLTSHGGFAESSWEVSEPPGVVVLQVRRLFNVVVVQIVPRNAPIQKCSLVVGRIEAGSFYPARYKVDEFPVNDGEAVVFTNWKDSSVYRVVANDGTRCGSSEFISVQGGMPWPSIVPLVVNMEFGSITINLSGSPIPADLELCVLDEKRGFLRSYPTADTSDGLGCLIRVGNRFIVHSMTRSGVATVLRSEDHGILVPVDLFPWNASVQVRLGNRNLGVLASGLEATKGLLALLPDARNIHLQQAIALRGRTLWVTLRRYELRSIGEMERADSFWRVEEGPDYRVQVIRGEDARYSGRLRVQSSK